MKTFYTVTYAVLGSDHLGEKLFDNVEDAKDFASHDFRGEPVAHTYRRADSIYEAEKRLAEQRYAEETGWW